MSTQVLKDAFNAAAGDAATCTRATLGYEQAFHAEWQVLEFTGTLADGSPFSIKSDRIPARGDIYQQAATTAGQLISRGRA